MARERRARRIPGTLKTRQPHGSRERPKLDRGETPAWRYEVNTDSEGIRR